MLVSVSLSYYSPLSFFLFMLDTSLTSFLPVVDVQVRKDVFLNRSRVMQLLRLCMQGMS